MLTDLPSEVTVVEVGPRDGLQNQPQIVPPEVKIDFIKRLSKTGLEIVEATSFVDPRWIPQLADSTEVFRGLQRDGRVRYPALVPNVRGLENAIEAGAREVSIFASATESFSQQNLNRSRAEALRGFAEVVNTALAEGMRVRAYLSMVLGDPWEGTVDIAEVVGEANKLIDLGCEELSLGDTIGVGTALQVQELLGALFDSGIPKEKLAVHFHDTYGQGLANVLSALQSGITTIDASAGGLGGCPFARSATGNLATEDLIWMLDGLGIASGVDSVKVAEASAWLCEVIGIEIPGRAARAISRREEHEG
jgi:hydroxymethylglutaryl-CoA lyase